MNDGLAKVLIAYGAGSSCEEFCRHWSATDRLSLVRVTSGKLSPRDLTGCAAVVVDSLAPREVLAGLAELVAADGLGERRLLLLHDEHTDDDDCLRILLDAASCRMTRAIASRDLREVLYAAVSNFERTARLREKVRNANAALEQLESGSFVLQTADEARTLSTMLAAGCPRPESVAVGLLELIINGIEHGNLEISYAEKTALLKAGSWSAEIDRRMKTPPYADRRVRVDVEKTEKRIVFQVRDEGAGFDFTQFLSDRVLSDRAQRGPDLHGRGIFIAKNSAFDELRFLGCGNTVIAEIARDTHKSGELPARREKLNPARPAA